jgi:hypothetical protein
LGNICPEKIIDVELDFDNSLLLFSLLNKGLYLDVNDFILEFFDNEEISVLHLLLLFSFYYNYSFSIKNNIINI